MLIQVLQANTLTFKVQNARTIFVYQDTTRTAPSTKTGTSRRFFLSNANPTQMLTQINQLLTGTQIAVRPVLTANKRTTPSPSRPPRPLSR